MSLLSKKYIGKKTCKALAIGFFLMPFVVVTFIIVQHHYYTLSHLSYFLLSKESSFFIDHGFDKLYIRSAPILYGIFSAYFLIYHKESLNDFQKKYSPWYFDLICLLIFSTIVFVWVNNPPDFFNAPGNPWQTSTLWGLLFQHQLYSVALALLLILADAPKGFILKALVKILSSIVLRPFGRLSFTTYMIHPAIFMLGYSIYFSIYPNMSFSMYIQKGFLFILLSYLLAIPCYLWIELPAMAKIKERYLNNKKRRWIKIPTSYYQQ
jgi:peptidoglycan/LPS O-acetylase OafA/YrhL